MSRAGRLALIVAAWVGPLVWLAFWAGMATSDGTVVSRPAAVLGEGRWDDSLVVLETYGGTPLQDGDEILQIEGAGVVRDGQRSRRSERPPGRRPALPGAAPGRTAGREPAGRGAADRATPWATPCSSDPQVAVASLALLVAGTFLLLRNASPVAAGATLLAGAAAGVALTAQPFGAAGRRGRGCRRALATPRRRAGGRPGPRRPARRRVGLPAAAGGAGRHRGAGSSLVVPFAAWACWLAGYAARQPAPARLQAQLDVTTSAVVAAAVLGAPGRWPPGAVAPTPSTSGWPTGCWSRRCSRRPSILLVLDVVPIALRGSPLVGREVLALVLVPVVLACWVAAVLGYRLVEIDATLRRSLLQLVLAALVGCGVPGRRQRRQPRGRDVGPLDGDRGSRGPGRCCRRRCCCAVPRAASCTATAPSPTAWSPSCGGWSRRRRPRTSLDEMLDHAQPQPRPRLRAHRVDRVGAGGQVRGRAAASSAASRPSSTSRWRARRSAGSRWR